MYRKKYLIILLLIIGCNSKKDIDNKFITQTLADFSALLNDKKEKSLSFVKQTDSILSLKDNNVYKGINNYIKGSYFNSTSNYELSLKFLNEVEPNLKSANKYDSLIASSFLLKSNVYSNLGDYTAGINAALYAKQMFENLKNIAGIYASNIASARIYQAKGELSKAEQILKLVDDKNNKYLTLKAKHLLANIYGEQGKINEALNIDNTVTAKYGNAHTHELSPFYNNKALCFNELKQFDSAVFYFEKSLKIDSISGNIHNVAANYNDMGEMFLNQNDFAKAEKYTLKSLLVSKSIGRKITELSCYKNLSKIYRLKNDYKKALLYTDTIKAIQKGLDNVAVNTKIEELNLVYETAKKEKKIEEQRNVINKRTFYTIFSILLLLLTALMAYNYNRKQKLNQKIERIILAQENEKAILAASETERQRISRDLHDNMGAYTSALLANVDTLKQKNMDETELGKMKNNAEQILSSLRETIWVLNNKQISVIDFSDSFTGYCFKILKSFDYINFESLEEIQNPIILPAQTAIHLNKILQELFQNSIKHGNSNLIKYKIESNEKLIVSISDNGIGYNENTIKKGNGLENIKWRASEIGAEVKVISGVNSGTNVTITVSI